MKSLVREKERAMEMRRKGFSYGDILLQLPVAKSSLSLWLRDFPLTEAEKSVLKRRKDSNISLGRIRAASVLKSLRLKRDEIIRLEAVKEYNEFKTDPLFHIGLALYWAEGSKRDTSFGFTNSDEEMVALMVMWIEKFFKIKRTELSIRLYTHKPFASEHFEVFWSSKTAIPLSNFKKTVYKEQNGLVGKKRPNYKGCVRITLGKTKYLKKVLFWQRALIEGYQNI